MGENSFDEFSTSEYSQTPINMEETHKNLDYNDGTVSSDREPEEISDSNEEHDVNVTNSDPLLDPYVGKEFNTDEEAYLFYNTFARCNGFGIRKDRSRRTQNGLIPYRRQYVCYKEGKYTKKEQMGNIDANKRRMISRENCSARMKIKKTSEEKWVVVEFNNEHTHIGVSPSKIQRIRSHKKLSTNLKKVIDSMQAAGMRPCSITSVLKEQTGRNVGVDSHNVRNYMYAKQRRYLGKDAQSLLDYFKTIQEKNSTFLWAIQVDEDQKLLNIFWADANSRKHCHHFGDVIVFDTTYKTNKYELPFAPFVGVNNHMQSILFGCALLSDETEDSFIWLFKTWLAAMNERHPIAIITDQDRAITAAVSEVFPKSYHSFCMWHILKKFPKKLSNTCTSYEEFHKEFHQCIYQSQTSEVFESEWKFILEKHHLTQNDWLESLYCDRRKWVPAYVRGVFLAGMSTTQRSEGMNAYFDNYINRTTPLHAFIKHYERALKDRRDKEKEEEYITLHEVPKKHTLMPIEKQAASIFTRNVFYIFQEELDQSLACIEREIKNDGHSIIYIVKQLEEESEKGVVDGLTRRNNEYTVTFLKEDQKAQCTCRMFEFKGMLCRHILVIFKVAHVFQIPNQYILKRWTKHAMIGETSNVHDDLVPTDPNATLAIRYNSLCWEAHVIAEKTASSKETFDFGIQALKELNEKVDFMIKSKEASIDVIVANNELPVQSNQTNIPLNQVTLRDPRQAVVKGRNPNNRMKSTLEKNTMGNLRNCRTCKKLTNHDSRTCPLNPKKLQDQDQPNGVGV